MKIYDSFLPKIYRERHFFSSVIKTYNTGKHRSLSNRGFCSKPHLSDRTGGLIPPVPTAANESSSILLRHMRFTDNTAPRKLSIALPSTGGIERCKDSRFPESPLLSRSVLSVPGRSPSCCCLGRRGLLSSLRLRQSRAFGLGDRLRRGGMRRRERRSVGNAEFTVPRGPGSRGVITSNAPRPRDVLLLTTHRWIAFATLEMSESLLDRPEPSFRSGICPPHKDVLVTSFLHLSPSHFHRRFWPALSFYQPAQWL